MSTRFYPKNSCDFYTESVVINPSKTAPQHRIRKNPIKNPVAVFRVIENPDQESYICSWGNGEIFFRNTNLNIDQVNYSEHSRIRRGFKFPIAGHPSLWKFNKVNPCKMFRMPQSHWSISPFLDEFRSKLSNSRAVNENESQVQERW